MTGPSSGIEDLIEAETDVDWPRVLRSMKELPTEALLAVMARLGLYVDRALALEIAGRPDAVFCLRKFLQDGKNWVDEAGDFSWTPVHILHILPAVKGPEALRLALDVLRFRAEELGDFVTEDATAILYAFGPKSHGELSEFTLDETVEPFARAAASDALAARAAKDPAFRDETIAHLRRLLAQTKDEDFCSMVADALLGLDSTALPEVLAALKEGRMDPDLDPAEELEMKVAGAFKDMEQEELGRNTSDPMDHFTRGNILHLAEVERSWKEDDGDGEDDDATEEEAKPPSKNAPCPCGSGKKYKRCCMPGHDR